MSEQFFPDNVIFTVFGFKQDFNKKTDAQSISMQILGNFTTLGNALICKEIYQEIDTTIQGITITNSILFDEMQDIDVMLKIFVSDDNEIIVRSQAVSPEEEPYLIDKDNFEALAYLEDEKQIIEYAKQWCKNNNRNNPKVIIEKSPAIEYFE